MKKHKKYTASERGSTTFEALGAIIILCFILFGMLQIYHWCINRQFCQYAAFYACKNLALGFKPDLAMRAARVSAIAISGPSTGSGDDDEEAAKNYMTYGDPSGVRYEYWHGRTAAKNPSLVVEQYHIDSHLSDDPESSTNKVKAEVRVENLPLLSPGIAKIFFNTSPPEPKATVEAYNYSKVLME